MQRSDDDDLLTVQEVARRYRVDDATVRRWIKSGVLEAVTLPGRGKRQVFRVKKSSLRKFEREFE
jgi:excisionase family DNA binding protein